MSFDPAQLAALDAVLRLGSFDAAAQALHVTPSAISQRIRALEERSGTALVIRGTPCTGTPAGRRIAHHASDVALLEAGLARDLAREAQPARLRMAVNSDSLEAWFMPALANQDLLFDLVIDDQAHSADWLRRGEVSAAITDHARPVQGCDAHRLGMMRYTATCAPDFHQRHFAGGITAESLARAPMLQFDAKDAIQSDWMRGVCGHPLHPPTHRLPSTHGFTEAARLGIGWGLNPDSLVARDIKEGRLVALLPDHPLEVTLYWQVNRLVSRALDPLSRAIRAAAARALVQIPPER